VALKCQLGISRDGFDDLLTIFGSVLPAGHNLPGNMYEAQKLLCALKVPYEQNMLIRIDASYLGKTM